MVFGKIKDAATTAIVKQAISYASTADPDKLVTGLKLLKPVTPKEHQHKLDFLLRKFEERHCALMFALKIFRELDPNCRDKFIENLMLRGLLFNDRIRKSHKVDGGYVPLVMLMSPTMRCNFKCKGCYAADYDFSKEMPREEWDRIITEAKDLGVALFVVLGGEPFVRKDDLLYFAEKHNDSYFQVYSNGALVNDELIDKIQKLGNIMLTFSIEGFEEDTDFRRHPGTFKKLMEVMDKLKAKKVPFGYSVCVTRNNFDTVLGDEFVDFMVQKGAYMGWHFMYMPIGKKPTLDMMLTPEQRVKMNTRMQEIRDTKELFVVDFWNDAPFVGGCIAGLEYMHVDAEGYVEPCIFTHFAVDNVKGKKMIDVFNSDFMKDLRKNRLYSKNLYTPCMLVDNPTKFRKIFDKHKPRPTHPDAISIVTSLTDDLDKYSESVREAFGPVWEEYKKENPEIVKELDGYNKRKDKGFVPDSE